MANNVRNCIRFIGNKNVEACMREIVKRLREESDPEDRYGTGQIGRVLYGLSGNAAYLSYDAIGGKWIYFEYEDDEKLTVITGWDPARVFQEYLLEKLVLIDPKVIIAMEYDDEMPNFIGVRYALMKNGVIRTYEREIDTRHMEMCGYGEVEETKARVEEEGEEKEVMTWEDVWGKQADLLFDAYKELKRENPSAYKDPELRWHEESGR